MVLGAAQLGMAYGIAGRSIAPDQSECDAILSAAWDVGVRSIDTASSYGNSERRIGTFLKTREDCQFEIISKLHATVNPIDRESVLASVEKSRENFGRDLDFVLLHKPAQMETWNEGLELALEECSRREWVRGFGVSIYTPQEFELALMIPNLQVVQLPLNVFDQRWIAGDLLARARGAEKTIFIRSVFLQGLLLMESHDVEAKHTAASKWIEKWHRTCLELGREPSDLALSFVRTVAPEAQLILGCDSAEQVRRNAETFRFPLLTSAELARLREFSSVPPEVYDPRTWSQR
ncbi:MAG: aldo/keto reductase [Bdellovibrionota bacterium]